MRASLGQSAIEDRAIEALRAKIVIILEAAETLGTLDEEALAEFPTEVAAQMRTFWANNAK